MKRDFSQANPEASIMPGNQLNPDSYSNKRKKQTVHSIDIGHKVKRIVKTLLIVVVFILFIAIMLFLLLYRYFTF